VTIDSTPVNDPPVLTGVPAGGTFVAHLRPVTIGPALTVSDVDNTTLFSATVRVSAGTFVGDGDVLAGGGGGLTGTSILANYDAATETLTLSGLDTLALYEQALEHVTFESTAANLTNSGLNPTRTIEWQLNDGSGANNLSTIQTAVLDVRK